MSYKACFFGVPASLPMAGIRERLAEMASELVHENGYRAVYLVTNPDEEARESGLRILHLVVAPRPEGRVGRGFFTDRWRGAPLFVAIYDDQNGVYAWIHHPVGGRQEGFLSDGDHLGSRGLPLPADRPPGTNALTVGLRHFGFPVQRGAFLDLLYAKTGWSLLDEADAELPPYDAGPVVSFYVETYEFKLYGVPPRGVY